MSCFALLISSIFALSSLIESFFFSWMIWYMSTQRFWYSNTMQRWKCTREGKTSFWVEYWFRNPHSTIVLRTTQQTHSQPTCSAAGFTLPWQHTNPNTKFGHVVWYWRIREPDLTSIWTCGKKLFLVPTCYKFKGLRVSDNCWHTNVLQSTAYNTQNTIIHWRYNTLQTIQVESAWILICGLFFWFEWFELIPNKIWVSHPKSQYQLLVSVSQN